MSVIIIILAIIGGFTVLPFIIGLIGAITMPVILIGGCIVALVMFGMMLGGKFQITIKKIKKEEDDKE